MSGHMLSRPDLRPGELSSGRGAGPPLVTLSSVDKVYTTGVAALQGANLTVHEGEFLSLLGPSGCGKSTLLRIIAGLGDVTGGSLTWAEDFTPAARGEIGFVFQEPTLMPWANVFSNVLLPLKLSGVPKSEAADRVEQAIEQVGLGGFGPAYPRQLSGGMRMRVSIARALVAKPRILLMDEPFAAVDEITRFRLNDDLLRLWADERWTIVFVTHSVYESVFLSTRIAVMKPRPGRVHAEIAIDEPYPREQGFRTTTGYTDYCRKVSALLAETMDEDGAP